MSETSKCACGCGGDAPLITKTDSRKGWVKGEYARFIAGHHHKLMKGRIGEEPRLISDVDAGEMTEEAIEALRGKPDQQAAKVLDQRTTQIRGALKRRFVELGLICLEVQRRELWKRITNPETGEPFHSFDAWVMGRLDMSRAMAYDAMAILRSKDVSVDDLREMPRVNAKTLSRLSSAVQRDPEIIASAKKDSERDFVDKVKAKHPEQHIEGRKAVLAKLEGSLYDETLDTFEMVKWVYDVESREDVLANLCAYFRDGMCEREGWNDVSNQRAYERAHEKARAA